MGDPLFGVLDQLEDARNFGIQSSASRSTPTSTEFEGGHGSGGCHVRQPEYREGGWSVLGMPFALDCGELHLLMLGDCIATLVPGTTTDRAAASPKLRATVAERLANSL